MASTIPQSFMLANRRWKVRYRKIEPREGYFAPHGRTYFDKATIELNEDLLARGQEELLAHTWEHELLHALFSAHGVLRHDERLIDGVAGLRRQYELTKRPFAADKKKAPRGRPKKK